MIVNYLKSFFQERSIMREAAQKEIMRKLWWHKKTKKQREKYLKKREEKIKKMEARGEKPSAKKRIIVEYGEPIYDENWDRGDIVYSEKFQEFMKNDYSGALMWFDLVTTPFRLGLKAIDAVVRPIPDVDYTVSETIRKEKERNRLDAFERKLLDFDKIKYKRIKELINKNPRLLDDVKEGKIKTPEDFLENFIRKLRAKEEAEEQKKYKQEEDDYDSESDEEESDEEEADDPEYEDDYDSDE